MGSNYKALPLGSIYKPYETLEIQAWPPKL
jgi:hypothetical protein